MSSTIFQFLQTFFLLALFKFVKFLLDNIPQLTPSNFKVRDTTYQKYVDLVLLNGICFVKGFSYFLDMLFKPFFVASCCCHSCIVTYQDPAYGNAGSSKYETGAVTSCIVTLFFNTRICFLLIVTVHRLAVQELCDVDSIYSHLCLVRRGGWMTYPQEDRLPSCLRFRHSLQKEIHSVRTFFVEVP